MLNYLIVVNYRDFYWGIEEQKKLINEEIIYYRIGVLHTIFLTWELEFTISYNVSNQTVPT